MSEHKKSYMQELDEWSECHIIRPVEEEFQLSEADQESESWQSFVSELKLAIREKVLESYHNGQATAAVVKRQPGSFRPSRQASK